jgi:ion channel-forming bestrophin family protein
MVDYNPKDWFKALFSIHKADTFRALFSLLIFFIFYSWTIVYIETEYLNLSETSAAKNLTIMHTILGFAISMLLVFRTNTAYDRWWEGRKLWGALVNNSRNLSLKLIAILPKDNHDARAYFNENIPLFSIALKNLLQASNDILPYSDPEIKEKLNKSEHRPNFVANLIISKIYELNNKSIISGDQLITLNEEMKSFTDISGACERIKNTPIPFSYSVFIKKFIFIYVGTLPIGFAFSLGYYTIPVTTFIFYVMASLEIIAEEIEGPFGKDNNDLPLQTITANIKKNVNEIFDKF